MVGRRGYGSTGRRYGEFSDERTSAVPVLVPAVDPPAEGVWWLMDSWSPSLGSGEHVVRSEARVPFLRVSVTGS